MLVLTRKKGDIINLGDDIKIYIVSIRGNKVQIGIKAPKGLPIERDNIISKEVKNRLAD